MSPDIDEATKLLREEQVCRTRNALILYLSVSICFCCLNEGVENGRTVYEGLLYYSRA